MITGYYSIHVFRTVVDSLACEGPRTSPGVQQTEPHKPVQLWALSLGRWSSPLAIKMQSVRRPFTTLSPNQDRFTAGQMSCSERLMSVASSHATGNTWSLGLSTVPLYYEGRLDRSVACNHGICVWGTFRQYQNMSDGRQERWSLRLATTAVGNKLQIKANSYVMA